MEKIQFFTIKKVTVLFCLLFLIVGCNAAKQTSTTSLMKNQMTGDQFNQLLSNGKTLILGGDGEGYKGELMLHPDGKGKGQAVTDKGNTIRIEGTWEVVGDEFCRLWKEVSKGKRVCERWIFIGENRVEVLKNGKKVGVNSW